MLQYVCQKPLRQFPATRLEGVLAGESLEPALLCELPMYFVSRPSHCSAFPLHHLFPIYLDGAGDLDVTMSVLGYRTSFGM